MSDTIPLSHYPSQSGDPSTVNANLALDENTLACLPKGQKVLSAQRHGFSSWATTARIRVEGADGTRRSCFLKYAAGGAGLNIMQGEHAATTELYRIIPAVIPRPLTLGQFKAGSPSTYFLLSEFVDMKSNEFPDPHQPCAQIVQLYTTSVSPTGKFGFHVRTCNSRTPQATEWDSSWTSFFTELIHHVMAEDHKINGLWPELQRTEERSLSCFSKNDRSLGTNGRSVEPCLIHGDLWEGNTGTSCATGKIVLFDAGSLYAHNEMEIGGWRCPYKKVSSKVYTETYFKYCGKSEPKQDFDDKNLLYSAYFDLLYSVNHTVQGREIRQMAFHNMRYLVGKFAP